jgi:hypothetical protein
MIFIGGFIGIAAFLIIGGVILVFGYLGTLQVRYDESRKLKERRQAPGALVVYKAGDIVTVEFPTVQAAARRVLEWNEGGSPGQIKANGEIIWRASDDNARLQLLELAK